MENEPIDFLLEYLAPDLLAVHFVASITGNVLIVNKTCVMSTDQTDTFFKEREK